MALFNVNIGPMGNGYRPPPAKPTSLHWLMLTFPPGCLLVAVLFGTAGAVMVMLAVCAAFLYAAWIVARWILFATAHVAHGSAQTYPPAYPPHPAQPPPQFGYDTSYAPPFPTQAYPSPPRGDGQHYDGRTAP